MDFDALRAAVVPGGGVVGRWPGVICVAECTDRQLLRQLLDVCANAVGEEPGRTLARTLAGWLGGPDGPSTGLRFGTVAVTGGDSRSGSSRGEQWAVFLYGSVGLVVPDRQVALSGAQSVAWTDRLLPRPDSPVVLALEGGPIPPGVVDGVHDLRLGVVPGAGAVLVPGGGSSAWEDVAESARVRTDTRPDSTRRGDDQDRPRWATEPAAAPAEGQYSGDGPGNGVPSRSGLDADGGRERDELGADRLAPGRAHLRPVPSTSNGSNGSAHRGWLPGRSSSLDRGRDSDLERRDLERRDLEKRDLEKRDLEKRDLEKRDLEKRDLEKRDLEKRDLDKPDLDKRDTEQRRSTEPFRDDPLESAASLPGLDGNGSAPAVGDNGSAVPAPGDNGSAVPTLGDDGSALPGLGDEHRSDNGRPRNGHHTNGRSLGLLGGAAEALPREDSLASDPERSPWSDGPDLGRPERIEGWFATREEAPNDVDPGPVSPTELRRRRHARRDEDAGSDREPEPELGPEPLDAARTDDDPEGFGTGSGPDDPADRPADRADAPVPDRVEPLVDPRPEARDDERGEAPAESRDTGPGAEQRRDDLDGPPGLDGPPSLDGGGLDGAGLDGAGDGTPRLGVPVPPSGSGPGTELLPAADAEAPHTTALRPDRILDAEPGAGNGVNTRPEDLPLNRSGGSGQRPPLGLLVFDDGITYPVDAEYVMGRMPEADPRVAAGALRSLALEDSSGAVSRVHAQIVMDGWEALLVDAGSRNGTFVSAPGEQGWTQLPAGEKHRLVPGTRVRLGGRSFQFESPEGSAG